MPQPTSKVRLGHPGDALRLDPKALPEPATNPQTHERVRHDRVDKADSVTLRHDSRED